ncbi:MAG: hypothetical protein IPF92_17685 [Myxococcales bacterium]|nr:hypothetical protein [Myxococcales bacterium]MBL0196083.1 hypothetical protein [Myxococcales bacterium]
MTARPPPHPLLREPPRARPARTRRPGALALGAIALVGGLATAAPARALEPEVTSETAAQFYQVTSPNGQQVLSRRRFMTTLGVSAYDLLDKDKVRAQDPLAPELVFRARLRFDSDYGGSASQADAASPETLVPGFNRGPVDLMYAYVEGRRFANGVLGFKLGRQYVTDVLGWWSFDGATVRATTPYFVAVEAYGGLEQRGGLPLSTPRFERDGIWRGNRSDYPNGLYPSYQPSAIAPAFGAAIESTGTSYVHTRLTYRRVYNTGESGLSPFAEGLREPAKYVGSRISQERLGYAVDASLPNVGGVKAGLAYDLYVKKLSQAFVSTDFYATQKLTLGADFDHIRPTFDGDSIWNFFVAGPTSDLGARASYQPTDALAFSTGGHVRMFTNQTASEVKPSAERGETDLSANTSPLAAPNFYPASPLYVNGGGSLSGRYRYGKGAVTAKAVGDGGGTGGRGGGDATIDRTFNDRYLLSARAGAWYWKDSLRPDRSATSFQYVLGAGYLFTSRSKAIVEFEHDINRVVGNRFRLMAWLSLAVTK